jgi:SAM-dependent methyltransferase
VTQGQLLEIGPGAGFFLQEALASGFQPYGIELNPRQCEFIRGLGIPCASQTIADAFPGQSFDVVYHCDVISHLHDPLAEFHAMHNRLRKGGLLMFETGNLGDVRIDRLSWVPRFQYPDHLFFFSTDNIRELLSGFELLDIHRYSLRADLLRWKLFSAIRRRRKPRLDADYGNNGASPRRSAMKAKLEFILRYRIGARFPVHDHHQTMIVLARKR